MKRIRLFLMGVLLVTGSLSGTIFAQEGSDKQADRQADKQVDKQREEELLKAIQEQKKSLSEQRQAQDEARKAMQENMRELEKLGDYNFDYDVSTDENGNNVRVYRRNRSYNMDNYATPVPPVPPMPKVVIGDHVFFGDTEHTSWDFTKTVKEGSFKKEYSFDVEKTVKTVTMAISGDCNAGEIRIKIMTPQGKTYSDVVIDEYGNINVRKSFTISETENQDKTGEWKFQINSDKATGYFRISFQTF